MDPKRSDYYALLGIDRGASAEEIGRAYRRAARATHPDIHPDEPSASERFTAITIAYETLGDPARRASYDRVRFAAPHSRRVEPVNDPRLNRGVVPIRDPRAPRLRAEPPYRGVIVEDDFLELAAFVTRLLRSSWG